MEIVRTYNIIIAERCIRLVAELATRYIILWQAVLVFNRIFIDIDNSFIDIDKWQYLSISVNDLLISINGFMDIDKSFSVPFIDIDKSFMDIDKSITDIHK